VNASVPESPADSLPEWAIHRRSGTAAYLHGLNLLDPVVASDVNSPDRPQQLSRGLWFMEPTTPSVVLGSAQQFSPLPRAGQARRAQGGSGDHPDGPGLVGAAPETTGSTGLEIVVRRSGGGAVMLQPGVSLWVDVVLPRQDLLWNDDVSQSAHWLGQAWVEALGTLGIEAAVHHGPADRDPMARAACFAGLGPGEVISDGRKVVGISQRRTRAGARFQCVAYTSAPPVEAMVELLGHADGIDGLAEVLARRTGVVAVDPDVLADALHHAIIAAGQRPSVSPAWAGGRWRDDQPGPDVTSASPVMEHES